MLPTERWPAILLQLEPDTWTRASDLARALGVSERTVYRDVQALVEAGVPLQGVPGKGYRLPDDYFLRPIHLTVDEAVMLVLGSTYASQNVGGRHHAAAQAAQQKLENALSPSDRERAVSLQSSVHLVPPSVFGDSSEEDLLRRLRQALVEEHTVVATVPNADGSAASRTINPYGLVKQASAWYVVGHEHDRDRVVHLEVSRIDRVDVTSETFERPSSYGTPPEGPSAGPKHRIRVVFSAEVANVVQVAPSIEVTARETLADDRLLLTLQVTDVLDVMPWLLSWGSHVQVLEPQALRERLAAEARRVANQYESVPTLLDSQVD